jgi:hypothetical protein
MTSGHKQAAKPTTSENSIPRFQAEFVKSFLYRLFIGDLADEHLSVLSVTTPCEQNSYRIQPCNVAEEIESSFLHVLDSSINATLTFHGELYAVNVFLEVSPHDSIFHIIHVLGMLGNSRPASELKAYVLRKAVDCSPYRNGTYFYHDSADLTMLKAIELDGESLGEVFLPDQTVKHLTRFVNALRNYSTMKKPLRYLLCGKPGTAKTKIIRAIANECKGLATFLFTDGSQKNLDDLFETAGLFSPVVICIDDVDMITGSREAQNARRSLANFLQRLDGFTGGDFFFLATTNDKNLVDLAASRPGRFDRIIDVSAISPAEYTRLVRSKTKSEAVTALFTDTVLGALQRKKASGAFIANIVKHFELVAAFEPEELTEQSMLNAINESHEGFYKSTPDEDRAIGFRAA